MIEKDQCQSFLKKTGVVLVELAHRFAWRTFHRRPEIVGDGLVRRGRQALLLQICHGVPPEEIEQIAPVVSEQLRNVSRNEHHMYVFGRPTNAYQGGDCRSMLF